MMLITIFDEQYRHHAEALICSFKKHNAGARVHVIYINPLLRGEDPPLVVLTKGFDAKDSGQIVHMAFSSAEERVSFAANLRAFAIGQILTDYPEEDQFVYMDADSLVRGNIPETLCDVSAFSRPEQNAEDHKYLISTIRFKNTRGARMFCSYWANETQKLTAKSHSIMHCQTAFKRALDAVTEDMDTIKMPFTFECASKSLSDWSFMLQSTVWCAKGDRKTHPLFVSEASEYA